jgi:2-polyprenyl-6-methoxyphenol hydroxylase-like FAD-dependent oxidoreductase
LPTELLFYGGVEVSGNKILLKDNDTRILLDFGKGFSRRAKYFEEYLIAADGANSGIRRRLGIDVDGPGVLYHTITAIVEADLTPALRGRRVDIARTCSARGRTPSYYWRA